MVDRYKSLVDSQVMQDELDRSKKHSFVNDKNRILV